MPQAAAGDAAARRRRPRSRSRTLRHDRRQALRRRGGTGGGGGGRPRAHRLWPRRIRAPTGRVGREARPRRRRSPGRRGVGARPLMLPLRRLRELIPALAGKRVVVVGDIIADEYLYGKPARISREAPVLILRFTDREVRLGGAANATDNVHALGALATPVGVVARHQAGPGPTRLFAGAGISTDGVMVSDERATPGKTRLMAGSHGSKRPPIFPPGPRAGGRRPRPPAAGGRVTVEPGGG